MTHDRDATYLFAQTAMAVGVESALDVAMLAATFVDPNGVTVRAVRQRLALANAAWTGPLYRVILHLDDDDTVGRFRQLQNAWNAQMKPAPQKGTKGGGGLWAVGIKNVALASTPAKAILAAKKMEDWKGAGNYQLGQILHLLHPQWFAIVNKESVKFWKQLKLGVGGIDNLEAISRIFRAGIRSSYEDFNAIDELLAKPFGRWKKKNP